MPETLQCRPCLGSRPASRESPGLQLECHESRVMNAAARPRPLHSGPQAHQAQAYLRLGLAGRPTQARSRPGLQSPSQHGPCLGGLPERALASYVGSSGRADGGGGPHCRLKVVSGHPVRAQRRGLTRATIDKARADSGDCRQSAELPSLVSQGRPCNYDTAMPLLRSPVVGPSQPESCLGSPFRPESVSVRLHKAG